MESSWLYICIYIHSKGGARLLSLTIGPRGRGGFRTPVDRHSFLQKIKMPSVGRQRFTCGYHFGLLEKRFFLFSIFLFCYFSIFLSRTLFWNDSRTTQPRRGYAGRGWLGLPCPWQKGGGETSAIGREALRVVDYVDSSMWYVPLWILESSALS